MRARDAGASGRAASAAPLGDSQGPRRFTDAEGRHWAVTEEAFPRADWSSADEDSHRAGYGVGWLHFGCAGLRRRLRLFPRQWRGLPDAELDQLCRRALELRSGE